ncbi:MAG: HAD family hydrolase [Chloroflexi bacterium]|nr:HAD family hydrolase [Chloroflexota bacterium]MBV9598283.1 HAD family hydrolase [Chloroflexota bacterium]
MSFDLNDTLVDTSGGQEAILRTCHDLAAAQPALDPARLLQVNREVWRAYWPEVEESWTLGGLDGQSVSLEAWARTLRLCGCDDNRFAHVARNTHLRHTRNIAQLFDDVHDLFTWLSGAGLLLALVTNGAADSQRDVLRSFGIEQQFSAVVISGELGVAKPDPAIFAVAIDKLGVKPEHVWHVGDSLEKDVIGAKAAGLTAVWLNRRRLARTQDKPLPDYEIQLLPQLIGLFSAMR